MYHISTTILDFIKADIDHLLYDNKILSGNLKI